MNSSAMSRPFQLGNVAVVKRMTIDDKIRFWREVMQYAQGPRHRRLLVHLEHLRLGHRRQTQYHRRRQQSQDTIAYFRASVRETVKTYPLLAGIGITAGENMNSRQGPFDHEEWLWRTYGEGIRDALKDQPDRQFRLIHRYHQTAVQDRSRHSRTIPGLRFQLQVFRGAHVFEPNPPFIAPVLEEMPKNLRTWLTVRNDDIYSFRWGDPDYARAYVKNIPGPDRIAGFYMGPDGYTWGREFIDREPETPRQLVMQKQWYSFALWGRLSYDPDLPNSLFEQMLAARFPGMSRRQALPGDGRSFEDDAAVTRFFWRDLDFKWFPEGNIQSGNGTGFFSVADFMKGQTMPGSGILNIRQWRARLSRA